MNHATYAFPEGDLHVTVLPAATQDEYVGGGREKIPYSRLAISSSTDENGEPGFVKIRGRRYRVAARRKRLPDAFVATQGRWRWDNALRRWEYTNEKDQEVGWDTAAARRLGQMVEEAAERFEAEYPDWRWISERLELEGDLRNAEAQRGRICDELRKADAQISHLHTRIAAYAA
ncbi:hypothetical protein GCM10010211_00810 [Streptomyces albospinus]|uniref:Uncharacterized protein n=1 Tax=Streptomyces albospinus TaxID=285515 RepID=A0ABQ2UN45_9ACTN|nr:hypothetical protein [Streptomyces albospinus]GGU41652.1 hypothetical protein GCM10010211_00810 [Streptomyces albospinus]